MPRADLGLRLSPPATFLGRGHHNRVMAQEYEVLSSVARSPETIADGVIIEVVSDVVCPWCFIGKRRLEKALKLLGRQDVQIHWTAFELNPDISKAGVDRQEHRIRKFGSLSRARQLETHVAAAGAEEIEFRFDRIERMPNTFDAHRLIWLAGRQGLQNALVERLFQAYFIDGEDVGNHEVLKRIGKQSGLDSGGVESLLGSDFGAEEIRVGKNRARVEGVNGVPTFFVSGVPITSGAHKPQILATLLGRALEPTSQNCTLDDEKCG